MSISITLEKMSIEEKIQIMEILWNDLSTRADSANSPIWHGDILRDREMGLINGNEQFDDWDTAKCEIRKVVQ